MKRFQNMSNKNHKNRFYALAFAGVFIFSILLSVFLDAVHKNIQNRAVQIEQKRDQSAAAEKKEEKKDAAGEKGPDQEGSKEADAEGSKKPNSEDSKESDAESSKEPGVKGGREPSEEAGMEKKKKAFDDGLNEYRKAFRTKIKGRKEDISAFLNGKEDTFQLAIADYVYATFGNVPVDAVTVKGFISGTEKEITYHITLDMEGEKFPYICSYQVKQDFFSLYSPKELQ